MKDKKQTIPENNQNDVLDEAIKELANSEYSSWDSACRIIIRP